MASTAGTSGWFRGTVKAVPSGDSLVIVEGSKTYIPLQKTITLSSLIAPKLLITSPSVGVKTTGEPSSPPSQSGASQVVRWPSVRTYRIQSLVYRAKSPMTEEITSVVDKCKSKNTTVDKTNCGSTLNRSVDKEKGFLKTSLSVKVKLDEIPIGRKVDLSAHSCYETFSQTLDYLKHWTTCLN